MPGCSLLVSMDLVTGGVASAGSSRTTFQLCGCPALAGLDFFNQAFVPDPGTNALGVVASNGGAGRLGLR